MNKQFISLFLAISFYLIPLFTLNAQWVNGLGPYGGRIHDFKKHENDLFACTAGGIYLSANNGESWTLTSDVESFHLTFNDCCFFAHNFENIYRANKNDLVWEVVYNGPDEFVLDIDSNGEEIYAATSFGALKSIDGGDSWIEINNGLPAETFRTVSVSESTILLGSLSAGLYRSENKGDTWEEISLGVSSAGVSEVKHFGSFSILWEQNQGENFYSQDDGITWNILSSLPGQLINFTEDNGDFFGIIGQSIYSSVNGVDWLLFANATAPSPDNFVRQGSKLLYSNLLGVFASSDGGQNWVESHLRIIAGTGKVIGRGGDYLYAGTCSGFFRSIDNGGTWESIFNINTNSIPFTQAFFYRNDSLYIGSDGGLFFSPDAGNSIELINQDDGFVNGPVRSIVSIGERVYIGMASNVGQILYTDNGGMDWVIIEPGFTAGTLWRLFENQNRLFATSFSTSDIFYTDDGGISWNTAETEPNLQLMEIEYHDNKLFLSALDGTILESSDNGTSWQNSVEPTLTQDLSIYKIVSEQDTLFICTDKGVYFFDEMENIWVDYAPELNSFVVRDLFFDGGKPFVAVDRKAILGLNIDAPSSISSKKAEKDILKVFPNPVHKELNFEITDLTGKTAEFELSNLNGQLTKSFKIDLEQGKLDFSKMEPGIYFLTLIINGQKLTSQKIIIQ